MTFVVLLAVIQKHDRKLMTQSKHTVLYYVWKQKDTFNISSQLTAFSWFNHPVTNHIKHLFPALKPSPHMICLRTVPVLKTVVWVLYLVCCIFWTKEKKSSYVFVSQFVRYLRGDGPVHFYPHPHQLDSRNSSYKVRTLMVDHTFWSIVWYVLCMFYVTFCSINYTLTGCFISTPVQLLINTGMSANHMAATHCI